MRITMGNTFSSLRNPRVVSEFKLENNKTEQQYDSESAFIKK